MPSILPSTRTFTPVSARHVVSVDGVHVAYANRDEVEYASGGRSVRVPAERYIAADGAPDGRVVDLTVELTWSSGEVVSSLERAEIVADLLAASGPLRSKFRFVEAP